MDIETKVKIYEPEEMEKEDKKVIVRNHWNRDELVVIKIGKEEATVVAKELKRAIENATGWRW